jgi:hypothetical protein
MTDSTLQHTKLNGIVDYVAALDTLCSLAQRNLYLFEKDYDGMGFNTVARYEVLRNFLLANPAHRLFVLAHDTRHLSSFCPRMMMLLRQLGTSMSIYQTPKNLQHITEPFSVADESHYVRRFHFDDPRGILAQNDPEKARALQSRFMEMWASSHPAISTTKLGL